MPGIALEIRRKCKVTGQACIGKTVVLCLLQTVPVYYPYATSDKSILQEYGTKVLKFPQKSEGLLIK